MSASTAAALLRVEVRPVAAESLRAARGGRIALALERPVDDTGDEVTAARRLGDRIDLGHQFTARERPTRRSRCADRPTVPPDRGCSGGGMGWSLSVSWSGPSEEVGRAPWNVRNSVRERPRRGQKIWNELWQLAPEGPGWEADSPLTNHMRSPNGIRTRVATLRERAGSLHRDPACPAESQFRTSERPPRTIGGTNRIVTGHPGTELSGGMLGSVVRTTMRKI